MDSPKRSIFNRISRPSPSHYKDLSKRPTATSRIPTPYLYSKANDPAALALDPLQAEGQNSRLASPSLSRSIHRPSLGRFIHRQSDLLYDDHSLSQNPPLEQAASPTDRHRLSLERLLAGLHVAGASEAQGAAGAVLRVVEARRDLPHVTQEQVPQVGQLLVKVTSRTDADP